MSTANISNICGSFIAFTWYSTFEPIATFTNTVPSTSGMLYAASALKFYIKSNWIVFSFWKKNDFKGIHNAIKTIWIGLTCSWSSMSEIWNWFNTTIDTLSSIELKPRTSTSFRWFRLRRAFRWWFSYVEEKITVLI